jgi:hypothetical protein
MKNKGFTYLLIIVVTIVWYNVFFRIKSNLMGEETIIQPTISTLVGLSSHVRDTFVLNANYRDPFESLPTQKDENLNSTASSFSVYNAPRTTPVYQWPKINYYGIIKQKDSKKSLCIIYFDDVLLNLRQGDSFFDDNFIKAVYKDSIVIQHKSSMKTFMKMKN